MPDERIDETTAGTPQTTDASAQADETGVWQALVKEKDEQIVRLMADFENVRRRQAQDALAMREIVMAEAIAALLPVADNLARALSHEGEGLKDGVTMTLASFREALTKLGAKEVPAMGEEFDPRLHEALAQEERDDVADGTIVEVFAPGYTIGDRLIRPSLVKVAKGGPREA